MSFNFKKYVKHLMLENTFKVDTSTYEDQTEYNFDTATGVYTARDPAKDPYTYKVTGADETKVKIQVVSAPAHRQSAVGRTFKIEDDNMTNPNVQLLYAAIAKHQPTMAQLSLTASDFYTESNFEAVIGDSSFNFNDFFNEQYNKIISVGKENANTELIDVNKVFKLSLDNPTQELDLENQAALIDFIQNIENKLETRYRVIVTSIALHVEKIPMSGPLREQTSPAPDSFRIEKVSVLMKKSALKYYVIHFDPDINVFISEETLTDTSIRPNAAQPIAINLTNISGAEILPDDYVEPDHSNNSGSNSPEVNSAVQTTPPGEDHVQVNTGGSGQSASMDAKDPFSTDGIDMAEYSLSKTNSGDMCIHLITDSRGDLGKHCYKAVIKLVPLIGQHTIFTLKTNNITSRGQGNIAIDGTCSSTSQTVLRNLVYTEAGKLQDVTVSGNDINAIINIKQSHLNDLSDIIKREGWGKARYAINIKQHLLPVIQSGLSSAHLILVKV